MKLVGILASLVLGSTLIVGCAVSPVDAGDGTAGEADSEPGTESVGQSEQAFTIPRTSVTVTGTDSTVSAGGTSCHSYKTAVECGKHWQCGWMLGVCFTGNL